MLRKFSSRLQGSCINVGIMALAILAGCDQEPAFVEQYDQSKRSGNAVGNTQNGVDGEGVYPESGTDSAADDGTDGGPDGGPDGGSGNDGDGDSQSDGNSDEAPVYDDGEDGYADSDSGDSDGIDTDGGADSGDSSDDTGGTGGIGGTDGMDSGDSNDTDGGSDSTEIPTITREMTFDSDNQGSGEMRTFLDDPYVEQDITLVRNNSDKEKFFQQRSRPAVLDRFQQGHGPQPFEEGFRQVADRPLDILVVVDNSGSMREEQANLASKLSPLLSHVSDANWRVGVVSTDPQRRCLEDVIFKGDANANGKFRSAVNLGTSGSGNERGVLMAVRGLEGACITTPWVRNNSTLAVLIVSDEDNCSDGNGCGTDPHAQGSYLYDYLAGIRTPGQNARVYGIFWDPSQSASECSTGYSQANIYAQLVADTQGQSGSICDTNYESTLINISQNIQAVLGSRFTLQHAPAPGTVEVFINDQLITSGYTVSGNVVEFSTPPMDSDLIRIKYGHGAKPITSQFRTTKKVYGDLVSVKVNGLEAGFNEYTFDRASGQVTFTTPPADRALVEIAYAEDIELITSFLMFDDVMPSTLVVDVDGVIVNNYSYVDLFRSVNFTAPPAAGSVITFRYSVEGPAVLNYPFAVENGPPVDLYAYDTFSGAPIRVTWANNNLSVNGFDFAEDRVVTVRYDNVARQEFSVELPMDPVPGSIVASGGGYRCTSASNLQVTGRIVNVAGCNFPDNAMEVTISFRYVLETYTVFTFEVDRLPAEADFQEWTVYVNGNATNKYTRQGNVITMTEPLAPGAKVKITLKQYQ